MSHDISNMWPYFSYCLLLLSSKCHNKNISLFQSGIKWTQKSIEFDFQFFSPISNQPQAGGGVNASVTERDFLITQQQALPVFLHHSPHRHMHKHNKWMRGRGSHGCGQVWIPAEQDHLSCITQTSRQPIEGLGSKTQWQWGQEILSQYGCESSVIHSSLKTHIHAHTHSLCG